jgi:hypothetical protein
VLGCSDSPFWGVLPGAEGSRASQMDSNASGLWSICHYGTCHASAMACPRSGARIIGHGDIC